MENTKLVVTGCKWLKGQQRRVGWQKSSESWLWWWLNGAECRTNCIELYTYTHMHWRALNKLWTVPRSSSQSCMILQTGSMSGGLGENKGSLCTIFAMSCESMMISKDPRLVKGWGHFTVNTRPQSASDLTEDNHTHAAGSLQRPSVEATSPKC